MFPYAPRIDTPGAKTVIPGPYCVNVALVKLRVLFNAPTMIESLSGEFGEGFGFQN